MMKRFLNPENRLFTAIGKVGDHLLLGLLWWLCSLPVFTVGAASAATSSVSMRIMEGKEYRVLRNFFADFRQNFRQSTLLWLAYLVLGLVLVLDLVFYSGTSGVLLGGFLVLTLMYFACLSWVFPYTAHFRCTFLGAVRASFTLAMGNIGCTALMMLLRAALCVLSYYISFLLPFLPGLIAMADSFLLLRAFDRLSRKKEAREKRCTDM